MSNVIETLSDVFALANNATELVKTLIESTKGKENKLHKDRAQIGSSGDWAQIGSSGNEAKIGSSGYAAQIGSSGNAAKIGSSGNAAKIGSSGDWAQIDSTGNKSVISAIGAFSAVKASKGSWITLAEYKFVKTEYVDGKKIKDGQFYCLYNHKFHEYAEFDGIKCAILSKKGNVYKTASFDNFNGGKITYVIEKDGVYSHGETIKDAKESFIYKISNRDTSAYENYTKETVVSFEEAIKLYRAITGACEAGTKHFVKSLNEVKKEYSIAEIIEITQGNYGAEDFKSVLEKVTTES